MKEPDDQQPREALQDEVARFAADPGDRAELRRMLEEFQELRPRSEAYGALRGQVELAEDFDELPADIAEALGAIPGAHERAQEGARQAAQGNVVALGRLIDEHEAEHGAILAEALRRVDAQLLATAFSVDVEDLKLPEDSERRGEKLVTLQSLVALLERKLKLGVPPEVAHRPAAYGGQTMLDLIAADRHVELLDSVRASFEWEQ
jgi:hypothetical protein